VEKSDRDGPKERGKELGRNSPTKKRAIVAESTASYIEDPGAAFPLLLSGEES